MDDHYQQSPKDSLSRKSDARMLSENKVNTIIADLIEKTKILAEELKNSNKIAAELMLQNSDLRKKYINLKDKFLQFLNDEEIIEYMENEHNNQQTSGVLTKLKQYESQVQNLKMDNYNLDLLNQKQQQQIQDLSVKLANQDKTTKASEILKTIDQNKDQEIMNLREQVKLLQEQVDEFDKAQHMQSEQHDYPQNQFYQTQQIHQNPNNLQSQPKEKMSRAYSQMHLSGQQNNHEFGGNHENNYPKQHINQQHSQTAFNSPGYQSGRDTTGNYIIPQMSNNPSQQTLEFNYNGSTSNLRKPLSQKNSNFNRNFNDYNELLYEQANEYEQEVYPDQHEPNRNGKNVQGGQQQIQNRPYSYSVQQQQANVQPQQHQNYYQNNFAHQNQYQPNSGFSNTKQSTNENQENNGSFENRQQNSGESNRLILSGGAGKSLIDPQRAFGKHQKSPSYLDPQAAAKYARSSAAVKKNQPTQKTHGSSQSTLIKKKY